NLDLRGFCDEQGLASMGGPPSRYLRPSAVDSVSARARHNRLQISLACAPGLAYSARMEIFGKILRAAVDAHASDLHPQVAHSVTLRTNRELITVDFPQPTDEWLENVISHIVPNRLQPGLEKERETDFSYYISGVGRFRTNVFQHGGKWALAMRHVKSQVPNFD